MDDADSDADRSNIDDKQNRFDRIEHNLHRWKMAGYVFLYFFLLTTVKNGQNIDINKIRKEWFILYG